MTLTAEFYDIKVNVENLKKLGYTQQIGKSMIKGDGKGGSIWVKKIQPTERGCEEVWLVFSMKLTVQSTIQTISSKARFVFDNGKTNDVNISYCSFSILHDVRNYIELSIRSNLDSMRIIGEKVLASFINDDWKVISKTQERCEFYGNLWNRNINGESYTYFTTIASPERRDVNIVLSIITDKQGKIDDYDVETYYDYGMFSRPNYIDVVEQEMIYSDIHIRNLIEKD